MDEDKTVLARLAERLQYAKAPKSRHKAPTKEEEESRSIRLLLIVPMALFILLFFTSPVMAATDDPLQAINNMSDFIFAAIKAIGYILIGFGIVQIGMSLKSQDAGQRATGFLSFAGGLIIAFAKPILDLILG